MARLARSERLDVMFELHQQLPDTANDKIGLLLAQALAIETMTKVKRDLLERATKAMTAAGYVSIRGDFRTYHLSRVGQSCQYDVPEDRRGALLPFRGMRVRMVCVGRYGMAGRVFLAGRVKPAVT